MKFRNVKVPEGINVSRHSPVADFFMLSAGVVAGFAVLAAALVYLGAALARYAPVSWENALVAAFEGDQGTLGADPGAPPAAAPAGAGGELQALADRLSGHMDLPEDLRVRVHVMDDDQVNAFATLGGHLFVARGLLERMPNENALAMVVAHEIAHLAHRDPAAALGGTVLLQLLLAVTLGSAPASLEQLITGPNALLLKSFSRETERRADAAGLAAVAALYGHVAEAGRVFELFLAQAEPPELLSTHPLSRDRIARIATLARQSGWPLDGPRSSLPPALAELQAAP